jgi:hypothetical protein
MIDIDRVEAEINFLSKYNGLLTPGPIGLLARITIIEGLRQAFDWLIGELIKIVTVAILLRKPSNGH